MTTARSPTDIISSISEKPFEFKRREEAILKIDPYGVGLVDGVGLGDALGEGLGDGDGDGDGDGVGVGDGDAFNCKTSSDVVP